MAAQSAPALQFTVRCSAARRTDSVFCPGVVARVVARWRRSSLDRALARGEDPAATTALAARTTQLSARTTRARIAAGLERMALDVEAPRSPFSVAPSRAAVRANRAELIQLAAVLRRDRPLYARGIAMLRLVLTDGTGPAYTDRHGEALRRELDLARATLGA